MSFCLLGCEEKPINTLVFEYKADNGVIYSLYKDNDGSIYGVITGYDNKHRLETEGGIPNLAYSLVTEHSIEFKGEDYPIKSVGSRAFYGAEGINLITIAEGVTSIGSFAFSYTEDFNKITLPTSLTEIKEYAFANCSAKNIVLQSAKPPILGDYAFKFYDAESGDYMTSFILIKVPQGKSNGYKRDKNWSEYKSIIKE